MVERDVALRRHGSFIGSACLEMSSEVCFGDL
jgi:hypothetical protein